MPPHDPKILYYFNERAEGRYYFCRILAPPPNAPPPSPEATMLNYLNDREGRGAEGITFCRILVPPPPDAAILNYLNDREGAPLSFVGFCPPPFPDATILNDINDRERGGAPISCKKLNI